MCQKAARFGISGLILLLGAGRLAAQATTIQLPTFNFFTVNTTVEVPDGGSGFIGGLGSAAAGRTERGIPGLGFFPPLGNRATGSTGHAGGVSVSATIHDFDAMDRALLGPDFDRSGHSDALDIAAGDDLLLRQRLARLPVMLRPLPDDTGRLRWPVPPGEAAPRPPQLTADAAGSQSVAAMRRQQAEEDSAQQAEAAQLFEQARQAEAAGKPGVAKIYYQMAARRASGALKDEALAELQRLANPGTSAIEGAAR